MEPSDAAREDVILPASHVATVHAALTEHLKNTLNPALK